MLFTFHAAESQHLRDKRFCNSLRLHHHGEGEKTRLPSAKKRCAPRVTFFQSSSIFLVAVKAATSFFFS
jgi:hypothetical protein